MARKREDSFKIAFETLREELRTGRHAAGTRLTANEIAERLRLSQTPVREALSRLTGEGLLLDRRGQGFFVPSLTERDLVVLFQLQLELLRIACDGERDRFSPEDIARLTSAGPGEPLDPTLASERLLRVFAARTSAPLSRHLGRLQDQLASARAWEPRVLDDLPEELASVGEAIAKGESAAIERALEQFFRRRIQAAPALARLQGGPANIESI